MVKERQNRLSRGFDAAGPVALPGETDFRNHPEDNLP